MIRAAMAVPFESAGVEQIARFYELKAQQFEEAAGSADEAQAESSALDEWTRGYKVAVLTEVSAGLTAKQMALRAKALRAAASRLRAEGASSYLVSDNGWTLWPIYGY